LLLAPGVPRGGTFPVLTHGCLVPDGATSRGTDQAVTAGKVAAHTTQHCAAHAADGMGRGG